MTPTLKNLNRGLNCDAQRMGGDGALSDAQSAGTDNSDELRRAHAAQFGKTHAEVAEAEGDVGVFGIKL
jgi:hypothetical protein